MTDLVPVPVGACRCPGAPHEGGDSVYLHPKFPFEAGLEAHAAMSVISDGVRRLATVYRIAIEYGIADWDFLDDKGKKFPVNPVNIAHLLPYGEGGETVREKATELYSAALLLPFSKRQESSTKTPSSSPRGSTGRRSTSPTPATSPETDEPS